MWFLCTPNFMINHVTHAPVLVYLNHVTRLVPMYPPPITFPSESAWIIVFHPNNRSLTSKPDKAVSISVK